MVRYLDPEDHPELERTCKARSSVGERLARLKEKNAALTGTEAIEAAREVALRQLDSRSRSTGEVRSAIVAKGFSTETADEVIDRLQQVGLVDDAAFARMLVHDRFELGGKTGRALVEELRRKGLSRADIEQALALIKPDDEANKAFDLAMRKRRSMGSVSRQVAYRRLVGMLSRKGYSPSVVSSAVLQVLADDIEAEDNE